MQCTTKVDMCYGAVYGVGCPVPLCEYSKNHLGECGCDDQLFISKDCTDGFWCSTNIPDPFMFDGCRKKCLDDEILVPNVNDHSWECVHINDPNAQWCPGAFNLECPNTGFGNNFTFHDCDCDGQIFVNEDCTQGFYCLSRFIGGGREIICDAGEVIEASGNSKYYIF